jgi:hypothetical protein
VFPCFAGGLEFAILRVEFSGSLELVKNAVLGLKIAIRLWMVFLKDGQIAQLESAP